MRINILGSGHPRADVITKYQMMPFHPINHAKEIALVQNALILIKSKSYGGLFCNMAFKALPGKLVNEDLIQSHEYQERSFDEIYLDNNIWISYMPGHPEAAGYAHHDDIAITDSAFANAEAQKMVKRGFNPVEFIAAVIVHEMAHLNGATDHKNRAETFVIPCGFGQYFDPK